MTVSDELTQAAGNVDTTIDANIDVAVVQRRTLRLLFATRVVGGVGVTALVPSR